MKKQEKVRAFCIERALEIKGRTGLVSSTQDVIKTAKELEKYIRGS